MQEADCGIRNKMRETDERLSEILEIISICRLDP